MVSLSNGPLVSVQTFSEREPPSGAAAPLAGTRTSGPWDSTGGVLESRPPDGSSRKDRGMEAEAPVGWSYGLSLRAGKGPSDSTLRSSFVRLLLWLFPSTPEAAPRDRSRRPTTFASRDNPRPQPRSPGWISPRARRAWEPLPRPSHKGTGWDRPLRRGDLADPRDSGAHTTSPFPSLPILRTGVDLGRPAEPRRGLP